LAAFYAFLILLSFIIFAVTTVTFFAAIIAFSVTILFFFVAFSVINAVFAAATRFFPAFFAMAASSFFFFAFIVLAIYLSFSADSAPVKPRFVILLCVLNLRTSVAGGLKIGRRVGKA
jgi:hypothetical protein